MSFLYNKHRKHQNSIMLQLYHARYIGNQVYRKDLRRSSKLANIDKIVAENPTKSPLSAEIRDSYLHNAIEYRMSPAHEAGLREYARRLGLPFPRLLKG